MRQLPLLRTDPTGPTVAERVAAALTDDPTTAIALALALRLHPAAAGRALAELHDAGRAARVRIVGGVGSARYAYTRALPAAPESGVRAVAPPRPATWPACLPADGEPCPWYGCRHHLGLTDGGDVTPGYEVPDDDDAPWCPPETCSLRYVAEHPDGAPREAIEGLLGITHERVRQIEGDALARLGRRFPRLRALIGE